jgi:hypothetical protein
LEEKIENFVESEKVVGSKIPGKVRDSNQSPPAKGLRSAQTDRQVIPHHLLYIHANVFTITLAVLHKIAK